MSEGVAGATKRRDPDFQAAACLP